MITDLPNPDDFSTVGKEWLFQAFEMIYEYGIDLNYFDEYLIDNPKLHQSKLSTAYVLLYQSMEAKMKSEIAKVSPLFLLDLNAKDWPTLPVSQDKSFHELFTIGAEALFKVYSALTNSGNKPAQYKIFNEVRIRRNQIIHGLYKSEILIKDLVVFTLDVASMFYGTSIWDIIKSDLAKHPLSTEIESEDYHTILAQKLEFILDTVGKTVFLKHLKIKGRLYYCLACNGEGIFVSDLKTLMLTSKDTGQCFLCDNTVDLIREDCLYEDCKGNVLQSDDWNESEWHCLTCLGTLDSAEEE